jgi:hypothetical protein
MAGDRSEPPSATAPLILLDARSFKEYTDYGTVVWGLYFEALRPCMAAKDDRLPARQLFN